jgi:CubicO group peptidase (beta-lactamase class C family)
MIEAAPMTFQSGEGMKYSNTNYYLLGMLIERTWRVLRGVPSTRTSSSRWR